ncbi:unnamed protein product [Paramecium sonneborni]|uniref:Uncharacterized protein n=1 Tax=Paramecium sonneborni TaxID=65129 RepID=A0A8S1NRU8_9CILI|nr:unnamed protein product [Paramecium sonneborni]
MQKAQIAYNYCQNECHSDEFLNTVCLDQSCKQERLLCCLCLELHEGHRIIALKKFLIEYSQQFHIKKHHDEEMNTKYCLSKMFDSFETEVKQMQQIINGNFDILLNQIKESKNNFQKLEKCQSYEQIKRILENISKSEQVLQDVQYLFSQIESISSKDGFQFQLINPCPKLNNMKERYFQSQQIFNDYSEFNKQICKRIEKKIHMLNNSIKNLFSDIQTNDDQDSLGQISTSLSQGKEDILYAKTSNCQNENDYQNQNLLQIQAD